MLALVEEVTVSRVLSPGILPSFYKECAYVRDCQNPVCGLCFCFFSSIDSNGTLMSPTTG